MSVWRDMGSYNPWGSPPPWISWYLVLSMAFVLVYLIWEYLAR